MQHGREGELEIYSSGVVRGGWCRSSWRKPRAHGKMPLGSREGDQEEASRTAGKLKRKSQRRLLRTWEKQRKCRRKRGLGTVVRRTFRDESGQEGHDSLDQDFRGH